MCAGIAVPVSTGAAFFFVHGRWDGHLLTTIWPFLTILWSHKDHPMDTGIFYILLCDQRMVSEETIDGHFLTIEWSISRLPTC